jgi:hypothetical protein
VTEPERLSDELEELLEAERDFEAPAPDTRERMLARLAPLLIPGAIGAGVGAAAAAASSAETVATGKVAGAVGASLKAKVVVAMIAGAVGAVGGAVTHAALTPTQELKPAPTTVVSARVAPPAPTPSAVPPPVPAPEASAATPVPSPSASARPSVAAAGNLRAERLLLERATAALVRGDSGSALGTLREHARRFPRGELAEEREVLLIRALRAAGQNDAAEKRAKDFKSQFPSSLQQGTIDAPASP